MRGITATLMLILLPACLTKEVNISISINQDSAKADSPPEEPEQPEVKKPVVVFGAGTPTGVAVLRYLVNNCANTDTPPRAFVIDPSKIDDELKDKVDYNTVSDITKQDFIAATKNAASVIVALKPITDPASKFSLSTTLEKIIQSMESNNVKMLSVVLSDYVFETNESKIPSSCQVEAAEHKKMVEALGNSSLNWVAACPKSIDTNGSSDEYKIKKGESAGKKVTVNGLAKFLVESLNGCLKCQSTYGIAS